VVAIVGLLCCASLGQGNKAATVLNEVLSTLQNKSSFELKVRVDLEDGKKVETHSALIRVARDPRRYWCRDHSPGGDDFASVAGLDATFTDDNGARQKTKLPDERVIVNLACSFGIYAYDLFCDLDRYRTALGGIAFFVQSEEVEGHMCDIVGIVKSTPAPDPKSNIRYIWFDTQTHLPRAFQVHSFVRGKSQLSSRWTIDSVVANPAWPSNALTDVPAHAFVAQPETKRAESQVPAGIRNGDRCPDLAVQRPDGSPSSLRASLKKRTLVTFWAPWCGPCIQEMKALVQLPDVINGKLNVVAIGVQDSKQNIRAFVAKADKRLHYLMDPDAERASSALCQVFAPDAIPQAYLFDSKGVLLRHWVGFTGMAGLRKELGH